MFHPPKKKARSSHWYAPRLKMYFHYRCGYSPRNTSQDQFIFINTTLTILWCSYNWDGLSLKETLYGLEWVPWIVICWLVPGGLAHSTGLSPANDMLGQWYRSFREELYFFNFIEVSLIYNVVLVSDVQHNDSGFSFWLHGTWDLSSLTRDRTSAPCSGSMES